MIMETQTTIARLLSKRLTAVSLLARECDCIADIGCDHGYISIDLIQRRVAGHVIAMDLREGPLRYAAANVSKYGLSDQIELRLSDGLDALGPEEANGIVIAGMGGKLMADILRKNMDKARKMEYLVLQPQSELAIFRTFLSENGFVIDEENMIEEDGKFYPMMRVSFCLEKKQQLSEEELICGPLLLKGKSDVLKKWLVKEIKIRKNVQSNLMKQNDSEEIVQRRCEVEHRIELLSSLVWE